MRKAWMIIVMVVFVLIGCKAKDDVSAYGRPDVVSSITMNRDYNLSLIANRNQIEDKFAFAEEVIQMCKDNSFETIMFSYDMGYPTDVHIDVYLTEADMDNSEKYMEIDYSAIEGLSKYNIIDNPDKFELTIN